MTFAVPRYADMPDPTGGLSFFKAWAEIIRIGAMMGVRFPLPRRNVEAKLYGRGIDIAHETVRVRGPAQRTATIDGAAA